MTLFELSVLPDALLVFYNDINEIKGSHFEVTVGKTAQWIGVMASVYNDRHLDRRYAHETKTASLIQMYFIIFQGLEIRDVSILNMQSLDLERKL